MLADTDDTESATEALALHRGLVALGVQMRTVALGPGRSGGLDSVVPVLAPAARSLAAVTQLRRERRWADVVVCWGTTVSMVQRIGGSVRDVPRVFAPVDGSPHRGWLASVAIRGAVSAPDCSDPAIWRDFLSEVHRGAGLV